MTLSPDEAAGALRDIAAVETHSHRLYGYRQASPHLILWGLLWLVGYGLSDAWPTRSTPVWAALVTIGLVAGFLITLRSRRRLAGSRQLYWRFPAIALTAFAFIFATLAVMHPVSGRQVDAFIPLVLAASYAVMGFWRGLRFTAAGAALAVLTLTGFFLLPAYFAVWMAACGGGSLILAGIWLRTA